MKNKSIVASLCSLALPTAALLLTFNQSTLGQNKSTGTINCQWVVADKALHSQPVMVSAIQNGKIVDQAEMKLPYDGRLWGKIEEGAYDVRVEGDGIITEVKRGVHVFAGRELELTFVIKPGKGVHIVEYATGGLSREEIAERLQKLEAAVAALQKAKQ